MEKLKFFRDANSWLCSVSSESQTRQLGEILGARLRAGAFVSLNGPLGAGKTTFCSGLGLGLEVKDYLASPTYLLCREYAGRHPVLHLDAYFESRLTSLLMEGLVERFDSRHVVLMEWSEKVDDWLPPDRIEIVLSPNSNEICRELKFWGTAEESRKTLNRAFGPFVLEVPNG